MSLSDVARVADLTKDTIWRAEQMEKPRLRPSTIRALAQAFGLTLEQFESAWTTGRVSLGDAPPGRPMVAAFDGIPASPPAHVRQANEFDCDFKVTREVITRSGITDPHAFVIVVRGPSMEPTIRDGDLVIVSPGAVHDEGVQHGRVYAVWLDGEEATLKRVYVEDGDEGPLFRLVSDNAEVEPIIVRGDEIVQMALVVSRMAMFEPVADARALEEPERPVESPFAGEFNAGRGAAKSAAEVERELERLRGG